MQWISDLGQSRYFAGPWDGIVGQEATLFYNDSAKFEARWVHLKVESRCVWTKGMSASNLFAGGPWRRKIHPAR